MPMVKTLPSLQFPKLRQVNLADLEHQDGKYRELRKFLQQELNKNPTEKFVIFAYFRGTPAVPAASPGSRRHFHQPDYGRYGRCQVGHR